MRLAELTKVVTFFRLDLLLELPELNDAEFCSHVWSRSIIFDFGL